MCALVGVCLSAVNVSLVPSLQSELPCLSSHKAGVYADHPALGQRQWPCPTHVVEHSAALLSLHTHTHRVWSSFSDSEASVVCALTTVLGFHCKTHDTAFDLAAATFCLRVQAMRKAGCCAEFDIQVLG